MPPGPSGELTQTLRGGRPGWAPHKARPAAELDQRAGHPSARADPAELAGHEFFRMGGDFPQLQHVDQIDVLIVPGPRSNNLLAQYGQQPVTAARARDTLARFVGLAPQRA